MLGHVLVRYLHGTGEHEVYATMPEQECCFGTFPRELGARFLPDNIDANDFDTIVRA